MLDKTPKTFSFENKLSASAENFRHKNDRLTKNFITFKRHESSNITQIVNNYLALLIFDVQFE